MRQPWVPSCVAACLLMTASACSTIDELSEQIDEKRHPVTAEWAASETRVENDEFRQSTRLRGPDIEERIDGEGSYYKAHLRASSAANGADRYQVYVANHLEGHWRNLNAAHDQDGIPIAVHKVSRKDRCGESGCAFYEHIAMPVSRMYLESRERDAIRLDVEGPGGAVHVVIPGAYVAGFLDRLTQVEAARRKAPAGKPRGTRASYCEAKFETDERALAFCREQARASFDRLAPARQRAKQDSFTQEARQLDVCMRRHNGRLGIDWMMVEHCFRKASGTPLPAAR